MPHNESWDQYLSNIEDSFSVNQIFLNELQKQTRETSVEPTEPNDEGELAIDIYKEPERIIVVALIAGVSSQNVTINFHRGVLTIRGDRKRPPMPLATENLYQECYWGAFSRSVVLPETIDESKIEAIIKNGLLIIVLPMDTNSNRRINITEVEE